jgi:hypothetical protein
MFNPCQVKLKRALKNYFMISRPLALYPMRFRAALKLTEVTEKISLA